MRQATTWNPLCHAEGAYPLNCMMEIPRYQISALRFDKFPNTAVFQCWKTFILTGLCSSSACLTVAMLWIKDVEVAKSVNDLVTSKSIGTNSRTFEMLDAEIASALKRIITNQSLYKEMTFRISMQDGSQAIRSANQLPMAQILESLYKMRIRESVQLQTVLAMYNHEIDRNRAMPSYQRLKTMVRRYIDQMIRTRTFRARNEGIKTGVLVSSQKGRTSALTGEWENVISGKQMDSVQEETLVVSATEIIVDNQHNRPLMLQKCRRRLTQIDGRKTFDGKSPQGRESLRRSKSVQKIPQNYKSESGGTYGVKCLFRQTEADRKPSKKSKKSGGQGSVALLKESNQLGCVFQDTEPPKKSIPRKSGLCAKS